MIEIIRNHMFGIILITFTNIYIWSKLLQKRPNLKSIKTYIIFILMAVITLINYLYNNQFIRIVTITVIMAIFFKILFSEKINRAFFGSLIAQILYVVAEMIFALSLIYVFKVDIEDFEKMYFGKFLTNFIISLIVIILVQFKFVRKFYNLLLKITDKIKSNTLIIFLLVVMIALNIFIMTIYYDLNFTTIMLFNTLLTFICFIIIMNSLYNKNKYISVYDKYNTTLNSLKEYEDILDKYRVSNHENKNQLLTIRNMLPKNNKKIVNYIDVLVENKLKDNDKVMFETSKIPAGGLRGLIYTKLLLMKDLSINYVLEISNDVKTVDLINNIDDSTMLDICKIIGVYLDNSIQAVKNLKEKYVNIGMYITESNLQISISNNYEGRIEIDKIEEKGYSSKGKGHGYGLPLTKEIIQNNKMLSNEKSITKDSFTQILKIKM